VLQQNVKLFSAVLWKMPSVKLFHNILLLRNKIRATALYTKNFSWFLPWPLGWVTQFSPHNKALSVPSQPVIIRSNGRLEMQMTQNMNEPW
jgi:hypothetical protein